MARATGDATSGVFVSCKKMSFDTNIFDLPDDVLLVVVHNVKGQDLLSLSSTCRRFLLICGRAR